MTIMVTGQGKNLSFKKSGDSSKPKIKPIVIYTDGACNSASRGGWGYIKDQGGTLTKKNGGVAETTSQRMELTAAIRALADVDTQSVNRCSVCGNHDKANMADCMNGCGSTMVTKQIQQAVVEMYSDSKYVVNGIGEWIYNWKINGWETAEGKPVKNKDLWEELWALCQLMIVDWNWVAKAEQIKGNVIADQLARAGISKI